MTLTLSRSDARRYLLAHHFLNPPRSVKGIAGVSQIMDRLLCLQVDPLNTVGQNVHLVMQARVSGYRPVMLEKLLYTDHHLVEGWDKLRSVVRSSDWPYLNRFRQRMREHHQKSNHPPREIVEQVLEEVRSRGPISSLELEDHGSADWRWAPAKVTRAALDLLFDWGEIGVAERVGTRKIYTPMQELLPAELLHALDPHASDRAYLLWHVERRVRSLGLAAARGVDPWLGIDARAADRNLALDSLEEAGPIVRVEIDGLRAPCYAPADALGTWGETGASRRKAKKVSFIGPLDNLMWDRKLIRELFGFDYTWEVYKPPAERKYGYYVLPVLYGDSFVARWEPKRVDDTLVVKGWWWEPDSEGLQQDRRTTAAVGRALRAFMAYLGVTDLRCEDALTEDTQRFLKAAVAS